MILRIETGLTAEIGAHVLGRHLISVHRTGNLNHALFRSQRDGFIGTIEFTDDQTRQAVRTANQGAVRSTAIHSFEGNIAQIGNQAAHSRNRDLGIHGTTGKAVGERVSLGVEARDTADNRTRIAIYKRNRSRIRATVHTTRSTVDTTHADLDLLAFGGNTTGVVAVRSRIRRGSIFGARPAANTANGIVRGMLVVRNVRDVTAIVAIGKFEIVEFIGVRSTCCGRAREVVTGTDDTANIEGIAGILGLEDGSVTQFDRDIAMVVAIRHGTGAVSHQTADRRTGSRMGTIRIGRSG